MLGILGEADSVNRLIAVIRLCSERGLVQCPKGNRRVGVGEPLFGRRAFSKLY